MAIEGNILTIYQIKAILDGKPVIASINEAQEIRNAIKAYELFETLNPNSMEDLLKAHLTMATGLMMQGISVVRVLVWLREKRLFTMHLLPNVYLS